MKINFANIFTPILHTQDSSLKKTISAARNIKQDEFLMTGEIYEHYRELMQDLSTPDPCFPFYNGDCISDFVGTVQTLMKEKLGVALKFSNPATKIRTTAAIYFENHTPIAYLHLYETLAKYKALATHANPPLKKEFIPQDLPKIIVVSDSLINKNNVPADFLGYGHDRIRIDSEYFKRPSFHTLNGHLEHELGHFYSEKHSGSPHDNAENYRPCSFLHLLTPEEKEHFEQFKEIFLTNFDEIRHWASAFFTGDKKSLDFPETYEKECTQLNSLDAFCQHIARAKNVINQLGEEKGIENLYEKFSKAADKLKKFKSDFICSVTREDYYILHPEESKAEAFATRAGANGFDTEVPLPVPEKLEEQLAKLGMPPPMTYTILPQDYFAKKLAEKSHAKI